MNIELLDTNFFLIFMGAVLAILGLSVAIFGVYGLSKKGNRVSTRLDQFVAMEVQPVDEASAKKIISREINGSLMSRTVVNWISKVVQFLGKFTPVTMADTAEHKLIIAGNPGNMHAAGYMTLRFFLIFVGAIIAIWINRDLSNISMMTVMIGGLAFLIFFMLPELWLKGKVRTIQDEIRRGLPDALDMLSVCASAGLGFDQSLQKISSYWDTQLGRELKRVTQEMEMGTARSDAMKNMSSRLDVDDLSQFISIIVQAEKIGMSYADVLHSQALQMRVLRQYRAKEVANKLPAKMIIPLALCILPALMAVILGPAIPNLLSLF